jgi:hypothetical protein
MGLSKAVNRRRTDNTMVPLLFTAFDYPIVLSILLLFTAFDYPIVLSVLLGQSKAVNRVGTDNTMG